MTAYGYISVSNSRSSEEKQRDGIIRTSGDIQIVVDTLAESRNGRPNLYELLAELKSGDRLIMYSLNRLSDNADEAARIYLGLMKYGISVEFVKEPYFNIRLLNSSGIDDESVSKERFARRFIISQIDRYFEEYQNVIEQKRIKREEALENGKMMGNRKLSNEKIEHTKNMILSQGIDFGGNKTDNELMSESQVSRTSFYKIKKEIKINT